MEKIYDLVDNIKLMQKNILWLAARKVQLEKELVDINIQLPTEQARLRNMERELWVTCEEWVNNDQSK